MKILIKFPTRERPEQCVKVFHKLWTTASNGDDIFYLITVDNDDPTKDELKKKFDNYYGMKGLSHFPILYGGTSNNKIHACNRDIDGFTKRMEKESLSWDIIILMSDDMIPQIEGWDEIIRQAMTKYYPDTDGCLWFNDGYQDRICTLCIIGRKYYDRFGYIYHPDYNSLFCDNEFTEVAKGLDKMAYFTTVIFKHEHFANNPRTVRDKLYDRNEAYFNLDKDIYEQRKAKGFPK